jgi:TRAP-type C4-dicarboxylate transport system substrate-binding protein
MNPWLKKGFPLRQFTIALILLGMISAANAQAIKLATLAPEGSSWMVAMRAGAKEIGQRTDGRVKFKFYGGGVQGNDKQVLRKMRIGQLHGGAFTSNALVAFQKDAILYGMPMLFNNLEEVRFARDRMDDKLRELLEQAGYVNFGFASGGFAHIMSNRPIANLEDMQGLKVWVPDGDRISYDAVKALGVSPVTMPLTDVLTGLQTELIDTIMGSPIGTIVLQWVREVMERVYLGFEEQGNEDNIQAYKALLADGMKSVTPNQDQIQEWQGAIEASNHKLAAEGVIDSGLLSEIECYVAAYRAGNLEKDCTR